MRMSRRRGLGRQSFGFLLAKALQRWNAELEERFARAGYPHVRASFGSVLVPLFEEDGLRLGELAKRSRLSKQNMTTMTRLVEDAGLVARRADPEDARAVRIYLTDAGAKFRGVAERAAAEVEREFLAFGTAATANAARRWLSAYSGL